MTHRGITSTAFNRRHDAILFFTSEFVNITTENGDGVLWPLLSVNWYGLLQIRFVDFWFLNSPILNTWKETGSHAPHCTQVCGGFFSYPVESVSVAFTRLRRSESVRQSERQWRRVSSGRELGGGGRGKRLFAGGQTTSEAGAARVIREGDLHVCVMWCVYSCCTLNCSSELGGGKWERECVRVLPFAWECVGLQACACLKVCLSAVWASRLQKDSRHISCTNVTLKLLSVVCVYSGRFSVSTQELNVAQQQSYFFNDWSPSVDWQGEKQSKVPTAKAPQTERRLGAGASCVRANRKWHVWFALILFLSPIIICTGSALNEHPSFSSLRS